MLRKMSKSNKDGAAQANLTKQTVGGLTCVIFCAISSPHCTGYFVVHDTDIADS